MPNTTILPTQADFQERLTEQCKAISDIGGNLTREYIFVSDNDSEMYIAHRMALIIEAIMPFVCPEAESPIHKALTDNYITPKALGNPYDDDLD